MTQEELNRGTNYLMKLADESSDIGDWLHASRKATRLALKEHKVKYPHQLPDYQSSESGGGYWHPNNVKRVLKYLPSDRNQYLAKLYK